MKYECKKESYVSVKTKLNALGKHVKVNLLKKKSVVELDLGETKEYIKIFKDTPLRLLCKSLLVEETPTRTHRKCIMGVIYARKINRQTHTQ